MTYLPQSNCRLRSMTRGGSEDDYDTPSSGGVSVFTGDEDAYLSEVARLVPKGGELDRVSSGYLLVSNDVPVRWAADDFVTLYIGSATQTRQVSDVRSVTAPGVGIVGTTKLYLHDR